MARAQVSRLSTSRCVVCQSQLAAAVLVCQSKGLGQFPDRGELASAHAPPPIPRPPNGAEDKRSDK